LTITVTGSPGWAGVGAITAIAVEMKVSSGALVVVAVPAQPESSATHSARTAKVRGRLGSMGNMVTLLAHVRLSCRDIHHTARVFAWRLKHTT
jgi:hypothetical protein